MGSPKADQNGGLRAVILTAVMLLALAPMSPASANSQGDPENLQAQNISAVFDNASETTLLTWENIATGGAELNGLFSATYMPVSYTHLTLPTTPYV